jgi:hypothetical protein
MRSVFERLIAGVTVLAMIAGIGAVIGVFVGSVAGVATFVFEALR